jgi:hypothetical protein
VVLAKHDVVRVRIDNFYRPKSKLPGRAKPSQHSHGLAADIVNFQLSDGRTLDVKQDFHGELGKPVCGPDAAMVDATPESIALRNLVCDVASFGLFHHMLTPNYNLAHRDHLHWDIKRDAKTFIIR